MKKNDEDDASYQPSQYREIITEIGLEPEEAAEAVEPEGTASDEQPEETAEEVEPEGTATDEQPEDAAKREPAETEPTESTEQSLTTWKEKRQSRMKIDMQGKLIVSLLTVDRCFYVTVFKREKSWPERIQKTHAES